MALKKYIPNIITLGNLLCGCLAILKVFEGDLVWAAYLVGIALVLDFFDGFSARLLGVCSPIGKDLDSLADMVTFGVVPGMVVLKLIQSASLHNDIAIPDWHTTLLPISYSAYIALIIPIFSCIRLAKFNHDTRQSDSFIGLPTPSNAMVLCSLPLIQRFQPEVFSTLNFLNAPWFLCVLSIVMSLLLVAEIPLFALKFKNFKWTDNKLRFVFLSMCLILLLSLKFVAIPVIILLYILLSIVNNIFLKKKV